VILRNFFGCYFQDGFNEQAPEVISGKETSFASDVYSFGMLMWEISSEQPPFNNFENDYELALKIINGMRPKIVPGTPLEYKELMTQCWDESKMMHKCHSK
jgi:serine/threonine protein kinase